MSKGKNLLKRLAAAIEQMQSGRMPPRWGPRDIARFWNVDYETLVRIYQSDNRDGWFAREWARVDNDPEYVTEHLERVTQHQPEGSSPSMGRRYSKWTWLPNPGGILTHLMEAVANVPERIPEPPKKKKSDVMELFEDTPRLTEEQLETINREQAERRRIQGQINDIIDQVHEEIPVNPVLSEDATLRPSGADLSSRDAYRNWRRTIQEKQQDTVDRIIEHRIREAGIEAIRVELDGRGLPRGTPDMNHDNVVPITMLNHYLRGYPRTAPTTSVSLKNAVKSVYSNNTAISKSATTARVASTMHDYSVYEPAPTRFYTDDAPRQAEQVTESARQEMANILTKLSDIESMPDPEIKALQSGYKRALELKKVRDMSEGKHLYKMQNWGRFKG